MGAWEWSLLAGSDDWECSADLLGINKTIRNYQEKWLEARYHTLFRFIKVTEFN